MVALLRAIKKMDFLSKHTISKEFSHGALFAIIEHIRIRFTSLEKDLREIWGRRLHSHRIHNWAYVLLFLCQEKEYFFNRCLELIKDIRYFTHLIAH